MELVPKDKDKHKKQIEPITISISISLPHTNSIVHVSIDIGLRNLGIFCLRVDKDTLQWQEILLLATFDICHNVSTGGTKCTSIIADNAVTLLDALTCIHAAEIVMIEEQFISRSTGQMNDVARRFQAVLLGYFSARKELLFTKDLRIYSIPSVLKLRGCPKEFRGKKAKYKEWTRLHVVEDLNTRGFETASKVVENAPKGDDTGDAVKQYVEAMEEIKVDNTKYQW